jgi:hypothetical protein
MNERRGQMYCWAVVMERHSLTWHGADAVTRAVHAWRDTLGTLSTLINRLCWEGQR